MYYLNHYLKLTIVRNRRRFKFLTPPVISDRKKITPFIIEIIKIIIRCNMFEVSPNSIAYSNSVRLQIMEFRL